MSTLEAMALKLPRESIRVWLALQRIVPKNVIETVIDPAELAQEADVGERGVRRALSHLENQGFLRRISRPPKPTRIIINRGVRLEEPKTPKSEGNTPPANVVDQAAQAVYKYWAGLWTIRFGQAPAFSTFELNAARETVLRNWDQGMDYVKMQISASFEAPGAPLLSKVGI